MLRKLSIGTLAVALVVAVTPLAQAEPVKTPVLDPAARFQRLDPATLGKIVNLPQRMRQDETVSALVQLSGSPVAVQRQADARGFDRRVAQRRVKASQDAALPDLRAAGARSYGRLSTVLNAVQVRVKVSDLAKVAAVPGVQKVQVSRVVRLTNAAGERFTGVDKTWEDLGLTGRGQVIGVIDTGIDYTHAGFGGPGTVAAFEDNDGAVIEPGTFPTAKVTGGYDFVGDDYDPGSSDPAAQVPQPDADPLDCEGHGSHVAGTAAGSGVTTSGATYGGPYNAATTRTAFEVEPGVAPQATLKAYRVFGCDGATNDDVIIAAIDRAVTDGVDVINMSLGSPFGTRDDLGDVAVRTATAAGVLVVTSAGNSGAGAYLVGGPSTSDDALSVAALDAEFVSYPGASITGAVTGQGINANGAPLASPITGTLVDVGLGCDEADYAGAAGKIALTTRGTCARIARAELGQEARALAVIMINDSSGLPPFEGPIDGVTIPFIGVDGDASATFLAADGQPITLAGGADVANETYSLAADFSSNGPRRLDSAQKPDVAAPGVAVPSVAVGTGTGSARSSGTSMAAPHTAGVAALIRQSHPGWTPRQVKAALMSTAAPGKIGSFDSRRAGTGAVQPRRATVTKAYAWTPGGLNSLRFGQDQVSGSYRERRSFKITNKYAKSVTYDLSTALSTKRYGADITISPRTVTVRPGQTRTIRVTIAVSRNDVARLPGAIANEGGQILSINGLIVAKPRVRRAATPTLRMSFLWVPVPVSNVRASKAVVAKSPSYAGTIKVKNTGAHTGAADLYAWLLADPAGDVLDREVADLTSVGVQVLPGAAVGSVASDHLLVFAASMAIGTSTQSTHAVALLIDTDRDGADDFLVEAADAGVLFAGNPTGTMVTITVDLRTGRLVAAYGASAPANGSTVLLPVLATDLAVTSANGPIGVRAAGYTIFAPALADDVAGSAWFDPYAPVVSQGDLVTLKPGTSASIPVTVDPSGLAGQTHAGWLVITQDDRAGYAEADRVRLDLLRVDTPVLSQQER